MSTVNVSHKRATSNVSVIVIHGVGQSQCC